MKCWVAVCIDSNWGQFQLLPDAQEPVVPLIDGTMWGSLIPLALVTFTLRMWGLHFRVSGRGGEKWQPEGIGTIHKEQFHMGDMLLFHGKGQGLMIIPKGDDTGWDNAWSMPWWFPSHCCTQLHQVDLLTSSPLRDSSGCRGTCPGPKVDGSRTLLTASSCCLALSWGKVAQQRPGLLLPQLWCPFCFHQGPEVMESVMGWERSIWSFSCDPRWQLVVFYYTPGVLSANAFVQFLSYLGWCFLWYMNAD